VTFRLAAYGVCIVDDEVLLARWVSPHGVTHWTLPGGGVDLYEDPFDAVIRGQRRLRPPAVADGGFRGGITAVGDGRRS
jgi:hypothetical protein